MIYRLEANRLEVMIQNWGTDQSGNLQIGRVNCQIHRKVGSYMRADLRKGTLSQKNDSRL